MDQGFFAAAYDSVAVTGTGCVVNAACDPTPFLKVRKSRKFMGVQDDLAVVAAGTALKSAGLSPEGLGERAGLFLVSGYIPFEEKDINDLLKDSLEHEQFSMPKFSENGFHTINPLLTFRCLPNMPAYHISANFDIQGAYAVGYPGPGQFYAVLEEALCALVSGKIQIALVCGVAHQRNFLVEHHYQRLEPPVQPAGILDAAGCVILERTSHASERSANIRGRLLEHSFHYEPFDPLESSGRYEESFEGCGILNGECGAASLPVALGQKGHTERTHRLAGRDGIHAYSRWEIS